MQKSRQPGKGSFLTHNSTQGVQGYARVASPSPEIIVIPAPSTPRPSLAAPPPLFGEQAPLRDNEVGGVVPGELGEWRRRPVWFSG